MPVIKKQETIAYQDFVSSEVVVPGLSVAVQDAFTKYLDVLAAPDPEGDRLLEVIVEVVILPIINVVGELLFSVSSYPPPMASFHSLIRVSTHLDFTVQLDLDIIQEAQVQLLTDHIGLVLGQQESTTVVRPLDCRQEVVRDVVGIVF